MYIYTQIKLQENGVISFQSILFLAFKGNTISNALPAIFPSFGSQQEYFVGSVGLKSSYFHINQPKVYTPIFPLILMLLAVLCRVTWFFVHTR